ncbi:MAG TPA: polysaccharide biosynthesis C-terminal domain-containing protein, partial [bacterium]|nr:polysaccharide biosynthesis C-terminal domain-containing protein [bacterium]
HKESFVIDHIIMPATVTRAMFGFFLSLLYGMTAWIFEAELPAELRALNMAWVIVFACIGIFFEGLGTITEAIFAVKQRFGMNSFLGSAQTLVEQIFALLFFVQFGLTYYFVGVSIAQAVMFLLRIWYIRDVVFQFRPNFYRWNSAKKMLKEYFPFYVRRFFRLGFLQGEQIAVAFLLPLEQLANFNLAKRTAKFMKPYIEAFLNPLIIKLSKARDITLMKEYRKTFLWFTMPVPVILALASPWIIQIYGEKYAASWPIMAIFSLSWIFYALSTLQLGVVGIFGEPKEALMADAFAGIFGLSTTILLILLFKEYGLAWGQVISFATLYISGLYIARKYYRNPQLIKPVTVQPITQENPS